MQSLRIGLPESIFGKKTPVAAKASDYMSQDEAHGRYYSKKKHDLQFPDLVTFCDAPNRPDQSKKNLSHEFLDRPEVLRAKMSTVADLLLKSKHTTVYAGAGLSRASGIGDYGTKASNSIVSQMRKVGSVYSAQPTFAHKVIASLEQQDLVHSFVQQNHDGLIQKAGFPQRKINEIHGGWYDPSNPVVQFSGSLRSDLFKWLLQIESEAQLCLCVGTSLSGMNADRIPIATAGRRRKTGLGTVIINLQQTDLDGDATVRVWAKIDDAMNVLAEVLKLKMAEFVVPTAASELKGRFTTQDVFTIPHFDANGKYRGKDSKVSLSLDLRPGAKVRIAESDSSIFNLVGTVVSKNEEGHYRIEFKKPGKLTRSYYLGWWWIKEAQNGEVSSIPIVNAADVESGNGTATS